MSEPDRSFLLDRAVTRELAAGDTLLFAGQEVARVYLVIDGIFKLTADDAEGRQAVLGLGIQGELMGLAATIDGSPQALGVVAAAPAKVCSFPAGSLRAIGERDGRVAAAVALELATQLRWMTSIAFERSSREAGARLAGRILDLGDLIGRMSGGTVEIDLPIAQGDLARMAGMVRETACKQIGRLREQGIVDYSGKKLRILRPDLLQRMRCGERVRREGRAGGPSRSSGEAGHRRSRSCSDT
jgi:CRP/FNR family transcriptional regulator